LLVLVAVAAALGMAVLLLNWPRDATAIAAVPAPVGARASGMPFFEKVGAAGAGATQAARAQELARQFELVDHTYCSYRDGTKYPNASRPIAEHPDQVYPNRPIAESHAMRKDGGGVDAGVQIHTSQSRVYLAAGEAVVFSVAAFDSDGKTLPLFVTRAAARAITYRDARAAAEVAIAFGDEGSNGDAVPGDGAFTGVLAPAQTSLAGFNGTIRTEVKYNAGGRAGSVLFDVIYSPELPATWSGQVREAIEAGSLNFYLKAEMRVAGRYIVTGRVDDAKGRPFALATFNDLLPAGANEVRLTVFGKLLRDQEPAMPLTLRDVDAYLLKENTDPDRALMPRLEGAQHVSKTYPGKAFSDAEWQSEERSRYLGEFGKDLETARASLLAQDPALAAQEFAHSECAPQATAASIAR
jgi:hypothetical protein